MKLGKIFKDSLTYPFVNVSKLFIVIFIVMLGNLMIILMFNNPLDYKIYDFQKIIVPYGIIFHSISVIALIYILGYGVSIFKNATLLSGKMPKFNLRKDLSNGLKHLSIIGVYFSIPLLLLFFIEHKLYDFNLYFHNCGKEIFLNQTINSIFPIISSVIEDLTHLIGAIPFLGLFFIFGLFEIAAIYGFVKNDDLREAFDIITVLHNVFSQAKKLIFAEIILFFTIVIFIFLLSIINRFYGGLIISLTVYAYLIVFSYRFLGLIYSDVGEYY